MKSQSHQRAAEAALFDQTQLLPRRQLLIVFAALATSLLICFVDQNGIGVALPTIGRDFNATDTISWAGTSALIANTIFQVLYGRLSDLFGRKIVFLCALTFLAISDLLCGFSQNSTMLYVFRGLAGVANGGITSLAMMIVSDTVSLKERGKYQGILGACVGAGNMIGPFVAAAFVEKSTWRGFFWLVSPLAAVCGLICLFILPNNVPTTGFATNAKRVDYWGVLTGSAAILLILIPVSGGGSYFEWGSAMVISMLVLGFLSALAFVFVEMKVALLPMMPLSIFGNLAVTVLLLQNFFFGIVYYSQLYYLPLFFQNALQLSPIVSAALILPIPCSQMTFSILSGQYISRQERYGEVIWTGFILWMLGVGLTCLFNRSTPIVGIVLILVVQGAGVGLVFQPTLVALQAHCAKSQRAIVISNRNFLRSLGGAIGLAVSAVMLQTTLERYMPAAFKYLAKSAYSTPDFTSISEAEKDIILNAYAKASREVFILMTPFMGLCLIGCLFVKDHGLQHPSPISGNDTEASETIAPADLNGPSESVMTLKNTQDVLKKGDIEKERSISTPSTEAMTDGEQ